MNRYGSHYIGHPTREETAAPAYDAAELLAKEGVQCRVLSLHTLKTLDQTAILNAATETGG